MKATQMNLIKLTDWETGEPTYIEPDEIKCIRYLRPEVFEPIGADDIAQELGGRTRIDTPQGCLLVREYPDEVYDMLSTVD